METITRRAVLARTPAADILRRLLDGYCDFLGRSTKRVRRHPGTFAGDCVWLLFAVDVETYDRLAAFDAAHEDDEDDDPAEDSDTGEDDDPKEESEPREQDYENEHELHGFCNPMGGPGPWPTVAEQLSARKEGAS